MFDNGAAFLVFYASGGMVPEEVPATAQVLVRRRRV